MIDILIILIAILLGLILLGIRQLVTRADEQAFFCRQQLSRINDQLTDIRARLRNKDYMTDDERQRDACMREAGIFDDAPRLD